MCLHPLKVGAKHAQCRQARTDLSNNVVGGGVIGDEAGQHNGGGVVQAGVGVVHRPHQGLQV